MSNQKQLNRLEVLHLRGITVVAEKRGYAVHIGEHYKTYHSDLGSAIQDLFRHYVKVKASESTVKSIKDLGDLFYQCQRDVVKELPTAEQITEARRKFDG